MSYKRCNKSFYDFTDPHYHKVFGETITKVFRTGVTDSLISSGVKPDGTTAWYEIRFGPVTSQLQVISVMLIVTDITERKTTEEEVLNSELRYRLLAENVTDFIWTVDGIMLMGDGKKIYKFDPLTDTEWVELADLSRYGLGNFTRIAINPQVSKLAVVVDE